MRIFTFIVHITYEEIEWRRRWRKLDLRKAHDWVEMTFYREFLQVNLLDEPFP